MPTRQRRVVVTGIGMITSLGLNCNDTWEGCLNGRTNVEPIPAQWNDYHTFRSQFWTPLPKNFETERIVTPVETKRLDKVSILGLHAVAEALESARVDTICQDKKRGKFSLGQIEAKHVGVILGTGMGGLTTALKINIAHNTGKYDAKALKINPFAVSMSMPNSISSNIGIRYSVKGKNLTLCASCASGTFAIGEAFSSILDGKLDMAITGGCEYLGDETGSIFRCFDTAKTLMNDKSLGVFANRPFDKKRSGFMFSEGGAGILVIEELEHALNRGANIIAEIRGYFESFDSHNIMNIHPGGLGIQHIYDRLFSTTGIKAKEIDYINTHGTSTIINDAIEAHVIDRVFGKHPLVNSTKSLLGHSLGASGAIESIITCMSIRDSKVHISQNLDCPIANLNFAGESLNASIRFALTQSFGFGGHNAAILFEKFE